ALGVDGAGAGALADAQRIERRERVGPELDARADLADLRGLLEDLHAEALAREGERRGHAADAAAGHDHGTRASVHGQSPPMGRRRLTESGSHAGMHVLVEELL